jgi:hypothetical protein
LYEGRQIYFGPSNKGREFFTSRGWHCPPRQTTADFLTSLTNPWERIPKKGWEGRVPRTPDEFAKQWQDSKERKQLLVEIAQYESEYPIGGEGLEKFKHSRSTQQASRMYVRYLAGIIVAYITRRLKQECQITVHDLTPNANPTVHVARHAATLRRNSDLIFHGHWQFYYGPYRRSVPSLFDGERAKHVSSRIGFL